MTTKDAHVEVLDSRRWPGPSLLLDAPGAVLDLAVRTEEATALREAWQTCLSETLPALGWPLRAVATRQFEGGATFAFEAPIDGLYAATEVNEFALEVARAQVLGGTPPPRDETVAALRRTIADEANPALLALRDAAARHGVAFLSDDDVASVGLGTGVRTWPTEDLPAPDDVDWDEVHDVPVVMVTGTNGKSTTVRLAAHCIEAAGKVPGSSSTDWIRVGEETLDTGDYSGPGGARAVLRHARTEVAVLETARGGLLRRGLGFWRADAAAILNVAEDHLGEWGVGDLAALVEGKFILAKAVRNGGTLLLNADDAPVRTRGRDMEATWFGLHGDHDLRVQDGMLRMRVDGTDVEILREDEIPITFGARARFNTSNALAACGLCTAAGIPLAALREGLRTFDSSPESNPGRMNHFEIDGVSVFADFAHNPHGFRALFDMAAAMKTGRTAVLLGQAGDRTDADVRALVEATWAPRPDLIVVKDMPEHLRGRAPGAMVALIDAELRRAGVPEDRIAHAPSELEAARFALDWARPGDVLLMLLHAQRQEVLAWLREKHPQ